MAHKKSLKMYSENYLNWVKEKGINGLTSSQHKFAEFLLSNHKEVGRIGDTYSIFNSISYFIKHSNSFQPIAGSEPQDIIDEWPQVEREGWFDWSLSLKEISKKYDKGINI